MYIETPRMIIRDFTPEDAADLHDIFGDDETMKNGGLGNQIAALFCLRECLIVLLWESDIIILECSTKI